MIKRQKHNYLNEAKEQVRKHNSDYLRRLAFDEQFQRDVGSLRKRFRIPKDGFAMSLPLTDEEKAKRKYILAKSNPERDRFSKLKNRKWRNAISGLLNKYHLPQEFYGVMDFYVFSNDDWYFRESFFLIPSGNLKVRPRFYDTDRGVKVSQEIIIMGHLTENEYKALKSLQNEVFGERKRRRVRKKIDAHIEIKKKTTFKGQSKYKTDREMADHIKAFEDNGEDAESLQGLSKRQANVIKQSRHRLKFK